MRIRRSGLVPILLAASACSPGDRELDLPRPSLDHVDPDVVRAIEEAQQGVEDDPGSGAAWGHLGDRYYVHDFMAPAAEAYARAHELDPDTPEWGYRLGWSLLNDRPAEAASAFAAVLPLIEDYAPAHEIYATSLTRLGRTEEAAEQYGIASRLDPDSAFAETGLGLIALERGQFEDARAHLEEAVRRNPRHREAYVGLARACTALGLDELASQHVARMETLKRPQARQDRLGTPNIPPAGARARTQHAGQLLRQGRRDEAMAELRLALESNPDHYAARWQLAQALTEAGRKEEALELLREGLERAPNFAQGRQDFERLMEMPEGRKATQDEE
jgi:tetratricopeptide (TPR) repeat protein